MRRFESVSLQSKQMAAYEQIKIGLRSIDRVFDSDKFRHLVDKYDGNRYVKHFIYWNQLLALMFRQLSNRESLHALIVALETHQSKRYHLGLRRKPIAKTTFDTANQNRDYRNFEEFAFYMMDPDCSKRATDIFRLVN